jgi:hypothetical protein
MEIKNQIAEVLEKHIGLRYSQSENLLVGELFLPDGDSYEVLINLIGFPESFPEVHETLGRIPIKMDRHMYPGSSSCCFTTRAKSQIMLKTKIFTLLDFVDEILIRFLENNSFFEINKHYFGDEYSHGKKGIIEGYKDILKIDDTIKVSQAVIHAATNKSLKQHQNCYCGSGRRLRKCNNGKHIIYFRNLFLLDKSILKSDLSNFQEAVDNYLAAKK